MIIQSVKLDIAGRNFFGELLFCGNAKNTEKKSLLTNYSIFVRSPDIFVAMRLNKDKTKKGIDGYFAYFCDEKYDVFVNLKEHKMCKIQFLIVCLHNFVRIWVISIGLKVQ